jgi:hypothetical protein
MKRWVIRILKVNLLAVGALMILALLIFSPIDHTPLEQQAFYRQSKFTLDTLELVEVRPTNATKVGWASVNITPDYPMPMAGYRLRERYESVHDSLYANVLVIDNGTASVGIISVDLLMFPSGILKKLQPLVRNDFDFLHVGATHTHNSVGGWEESWGGQLVEGDYDSAWVNATVRKIYTALLEAKATRLPAHIAYGESNASALVANRLMPSPLTDGKLRSIRIARSDSSTGLLYTFSAHANIINKKSTALSADYPGEVNRLLKQQGYTFSMYMAGMVASHRTKYLNDYNPMKDFTLMDLYSKEVTRRLLYTRYKAIEDSATIRMATMPVTFGPSQLRIANDWRVRPWVFNIAFDPLQGNLTLLTMGSIRLVGTPCDFSGEIYNQYFSDQTDPLLITSFNGGYVGYITEDSKYTKSTRTEVRNMNWVGPYHGQYFAELIQELLRK